MTAPTFHGARRRRRRPGRRTAAPLTVVCALVATAAVTGCGEQREDGVYTILNSSTDESHHRWDAAALDHCAERYDITIRQQSVPAPQVMTKALRMASSESLPDIIQFDASEMPVFAEAGGLVDLRTLGLSTRNIPPGIVDFGSYRGTYYGAARTVNTLALFYDKDVFEEAGLRPPTTWAEMKETAKKLTRGKRYGLALSAGGAEDGVFQFLPFLWSNGGDETDLDGAPAVEALDYWKSLIRDGSLSKSTVNWTQADVNDQFMAGEAAMMINGPWQVESLNADKSLRWGITAIPVPDRGHRPVGPLGGGVLTVPKTGDDARQRMAGKIIACLSGKQAQITYARDSWMVPAGSDAAAVWRQEVPELDPLADQVATARSRTAKVGARWPSVSLALRSALQSALTGESSEAALQRAQRRATSGS